MGLPQGCSHPCSPMGAAGHPRRAMTSLLRAGCAGGACLIPASWPGPAGCFSLSVRGCWAAVTHYRIHRLDNGWLYIAPRLTFPSLHSLVEHYSGKALAPGSVCALQGGRWRPVPHLHWGADGGVHPVTAPAPCTECGEGLCCALGEPCSTDGVRVAPVPAMPAVVRKPSLNWDKIDR